MRNTTLSKYARYHGLDKLIRTGSTPQEQALATKMKVQADVVEALIGVTALDMGRGRQKGGRSWASSFARDIVGPIGYWLLQQFTDGFLKG